MTSYQVCLAGLPVRISLRHAQAGAPLRPYLADDGEAPVADVMLTDAEWAQVRRAAPERMTDAAAEFSSLPLPVSDALLPYDRCLFHGTAFVWRGRAYIFTAPSGTGKTTQFVWWKLLYGDEIRVINGDKPLLRLAEDGRVWVCPSPWQGKEGLGTQSSAPLGGIIILAQGPENVLRRAEKQRLSRRCISSCCFQRRHLSSSIRLAAWRKRCCAWSRCGYSLTGATKRLQRSRTMGYWQMKVRTVKDKYENRSEDKLDCRAATNVKYQVHDGIILREIDGQPVLLAVRGAGCPRILPLNVTGAFYFRMAQAGATRSDMIARAVDAYGVGADKVGPGLDAFLAFLCQKGFITPAASDR